MAKRINDNAMGQLLDGLTGGDFTTENAPAGRPNEDAADSVIRGTHPKTAQRERVCTSLNKTLMSKIRTISEKEGVQINELITLGLNMVVSKYEEQHGQIRPKKGVRGDINTIFR